MSMIIREEQPADLTGVRTLNLAAFPNEAEADLIEALRDNGKASLSLVAISEEQVIGHILFSPVTMASNDGTCQVLGLGPMAVLPQWQGQGVGSRLVREGLERCRASGAGCVVVLGHPGFYPRFGFQVASSHGIQCEYDVPDPVFMVAELAEGALGSISGLARYQPEFEVV